MKVMKMKINRILYQIEINQFKLNCDKLLKMYEIIFWEVLHKFEFRLFLVASI